MKTIPPLLKMRAQVSEDGRVARFFLLFGGGLHSAFSIPFHKVGLFLRAIRNTVSTMAARVADHDARAAAEISEGLAEALSIKAVASGRNESGEKLLWIETVESGAFAFRLSSDVAEMLMDIECQNDNNSHHGTRRRLGSQVLRPGRRDDHHFRAFSLIFLTGRTGKRSGS